MDNSDPAADSWTCEAYGDDDAVIAAGAMCFFGDVGERVCASHLECTLSMATERRRVFRAIQELSARDGLDGSHAYLERAFTSPDQLLGGGAADDDRPQ